MGHLFFASSLLETHKHDVQSILLESLEVETNAIELYKTLLNQIGDCGGSSSKKNYTN